MTTKQPAFRNRRFDVYSTETDGLYIHEKNHEYVTVVALRDEQLVVVRQYREAVQSLTHELPGGRMEGAEDRETAARRELLEETGLVCGELVPLGTIHSHACLINSVVHLFFTREILSEQVQHLDDDEDIDVLAVPLSEAFARIADGTWTDTELLSALLLARLHNHI